jgi:hypothetical protein
MKKWMVGLLVGIGAIGLGIGGAFLVNHLNPVTNSTTLIDDTWNQPYANGVGPRGGMQPGYGRGGRQGGMMNPYSPLQQPQTEPSGERITSDTAVSNAQEYLKNYSVDLKISEVMEFQENFYIVVTETQTGRGAMELLVNPYTGAVSPEIGPNMMWNLKYGHMGQNGSAVDNSLTLEEALAKAQAAVVEKYPGATVNADGISFYGYYTFDYSIDGKVAGMLSVNGLDGQVWLHTWHGEFISEKEIK